MINLHERMLPTSAGVEPATSWSPVGQLIQLSHRGRLTLGGRFSHLAADVFSLLNKENIFIRITCQSYVGVQFCHVMRKWYLLLMWTVEAKISWSGPLLATCSKDLSFMTGLKQRNQSNSYILKGMETLPGRQLLILCLPQNMVHL